MLVKKKKNYDKLHLKDTSYLKHSNLFSPFANRISLVKILDESPNLELARYYSEQVVLDIKEKFQVSLDLK